MNNTRNLLLIAIITATLVMGTGVIPLQSYADGGYSDDRKKDNDYKSKTSSSYESDKKSANQHQDQDNFCYRGDDCEQANQGQQIVGKDNDAKGFNDQSDNLAISALGTGNGTTPTPTPSLCVECFSSLTSAQITFIALNLSDATSTTVQSICDILAGTIPVENLQAALIGAGLGLQERVDLINCLRAAGITFSS